MFPYYGSQVSYLKSFDEPSGSNFLTSGETATYLTGGGDHCAYSRNGYVCGVLTHA